MYAMFAVVYICCRGRAVTNVVRTCSPTPLLKRQLNMFKLRGLGLMVVHQLYLNVFVVQMFHKMHQIIINFHGRNI